MNNLQEVTQEVKPAINFERLCRVVTAGTVWPTLAVGDKVLYRTTQRHTGWQRDAKAILVRKPADMQRKATIKVRGKDAAGNVEWRTKVVETYTLFRFEWPDAQPVEAKPVAEMQDCLTLPDLLLCSVQAAEAVEESMSEGEFMHMTVDNLRSGRLTNNCRLTDYELDAMQAETIGLEFSTRPFQF